MAVQGRPYNRPQRNTKTCSCLFDKFLWCLFDVVHQISKTQYRKIAGLKKERLINRIRTTTLRREIKAHYSTFKVPSIKASSTEDITEWSSSLRPAWGVVTSSLILVKKLKCWDGSFLHVDMMATQCLHWIPSGLSTSLLVLWCLILEFIELLTEKRALHVIYFPVYIFISLHTMSSDASRTHCSDLILLRCMLVYNIFNVYIECS